MAPVTLGIIGFGIMGERLLRAALEHDPGTIAVAGVWDPSAAALSRLQATLPNVPQHATVEELIGASDCIYIASPPASHLDYAAKAMAAGRAFFCEKPLAVDLTSARSFAAEVDARSARAAVNFPFASSLAVDQLRNWQATGTLGEIQSLSIDVSFATWPRPWQADAAAWLDGRQEGGFTREVLSHFLFLSRRLLGPLHLLAHAVDYPLAGRSERSVSARLMAGQVPMKLTGNVGDTDAADHNLWVLRGSKGAIRLRDWSVPERMTEAGTWVEPANALSMDAARPLVLRRQLDKVAAMTRGEPHDLATVREALDVQEIVEAILA